MKKIFFTLIAIFSIAAANAQTNHTNSPGMNGNTGNMNPDRTGSSTIKHGDNTTMQQDQSGTDTKKAKHARKSGKKHHDSKTSNTTNTPAGIAPQTTNGAGMTNPK